LSSVSRQSKEDVEYLLDDRMQVQLLPAENFSGFTAREKNAPYFFFSLHSKIKKIG
jgi:hypothetical protein